jgi:cardiolipin synthase (CMP-forming)
MFWADRAARYASAVYLVLGLAWAYLGWQPGPALLEALYFVAVATAGLRVPGLANQVTLSRIYLAAPAFVYAWHSDYALLAIVVAVAGLTDLVDGTIARRLQRPSSLGGALDPVADGVFMAGLGIGLALSGAFPLWLALVVIARYFLPAAVGGLLIAMGHRPELRHTLTGQVSTSLILILLGGVALLRGLKQDPGNLVPAAEIVIPIATIATFVHLGFAASRRPAIAAEGG